MRTKKILQIISVIILFSASALIFWAGLAPESFSRFFARYPAVSQTVKVIGLDGDELEIATSSEPVTGSAGEILLRGNSWGVEIVKTELDKENGLSNRQTLRHSQGMLFVFDRPGRQNFWMKDMLIPLDMIFFDENWRIVLIEENLAPDSFPTVFGREVLSQYVLEINAGEAAAYGLAVGDRAIFSNR